MFSSRKVMNEVFFGADRKPNKLRLFIRSIDLRYLAVADQKVRFVIIDRSNRKRSIIRNNFIRIIMITPPVSDTPNKSYISREENRPSCMISCRSNLGDCGKLVRNPRRVATPLKMGGNDAFWAPQVVTF